MTLKLRGTGQTGSGPLKKGVKKGSKMGPILDPLFDPLFTGLASTPQFEGHLQGIWAPTGQDPSKRGPKKGSKMGQKGVKKGQNRGFGTIFWTPFLRVPYSSPLAFVQNRSKSGS